MHFTEYTVETGKQTKFLKTNDIFRGKRCRSEKNRLIDERKGSFREMKNAGF